MPSPTRYPRQGENLDFGRVVFFTDAVFAIAMTLLVVEIGVPEAVEGAGDDPGVLIDLLQDKVPLVLAFFIGCFVIGSYWVAHHQFASRLAAVDRGFLGLSVVYLAFVALLPFPTGVLGEFGSNPVSVVAFAANMIAVSVMEAVLFRHARRRGLLRKEWPEQVYRWTMLASLSPVVMFALSVPVAFVSAQLAVVLWFLAIPLGRLLDRRRPEGSEQYLA
jgi:uncharacterized membrane protein